MTTAASVAKWHRLFMIGSPFPARLVGRGGAKVQNWLKRICRRGPGGWSMGARKPIEWRGGGRLWAKKKLRPGGVWRPGLSLARAFATAMRANRDADKS